KSLRTGAKHTMATDTKQGEQTLQPAQHQTRRPGIESVMEPQPRSTGSQYKPAGKLSGKAALVTGGDSGIGRAVAVLYAKEGADVAVVYLPAEQSDAEETKRAVAAAGRSCLLLPGDVTDPAFCERAVADTVKAFGRLDVLVNNAAYQQRQAGLGEITNEQLETTFRTNIFSFFYLTRAALPHLRPGAC